MSKINIDDVSLEIVGNIIKLNYPPNYKLEINYNYSANKNYNYDSNVSSLANQIASVEANFNKQWADK